MVEEERRPTVENPDNVERDFVRIRGEMMRTGAEKDMQKEAERIMNLVRESLSKIGRVRDITIASTCTQALANMLAAKAGVIEMDAYDHDELHRQVEEGKDPYERFPAHSTVRQHELSSLPDPLPGKSGDKTWREIFERNDQASVQSRTTAQLVGDYCHWGRILAEVAQKLAKEGSPESEYQQTFEKAKAHVFYAATKLYDSMMVVAKTRIPKNIPGSEKKDE